MEVTDLTLFLTTDWPRMDAFSHLLFITMILVKNRDTDCVALLWGKENIIIQVSGKKKSEKIL